ncbi:Conserved_hypothetical protein [Hexamita inflata]|uniref:Transmembrane protein n=1 Tax=Hexamita inflata TaxID=28002 RepID=A0AA86UN28_9EUKA|nr:Conserved hypothetical protein [Hexamita inflata]
MTELINCYSQGNFLTYNKDARIFKIQLYPNRNIQCKLFPSDVLVNLTVSSSCFPDVLQIIVSDFNYLDTDQLIFRIPNEVDLSSYHDDIYARMRIYSYGYYADVKINVFDVLQSDLQNCFDILDIYLQNNELRLQVCPTLLCKSQMVGYTPGALAYIHNLYLSIYKFKYLLNLQNFLINYQTNLCYTESIIISQQNYQALIYQSFLFGQLVLESMQGKSSVVLKYDTNIILDNISDLFTRKELFMYQNLTESGYQVIIDYDPIQYQSVINIISNIQYDHVTYRLTGAILKQQEYLIQGSAEFDSTLRKITFSCSTGSLVDQKRCQKMIDDDFFAYIASPVYNLDIIFMQRDIIVHQMKATSLVPRYSCWKYGVAVVSSQNVRLELDRNHKCDNDSQFYDFSNNSMWFEVENNDKLVYSYNYFYPILDPTKINVFSFSCSVINCQLISKQSRITFKFQEGDFIQQIQVNKFDLQTERDFNSKICLISGVVSAIGVFVLTVFKLFKTRSILKSIKRHQHKKDVKD